MSMIFRPVPWVDGIVESHRRWLEKDDRRPGPPRDLLRREAVQEQVPRLPQGDGGDVQCPAYMTPDGLCDVVSAEQSGYGDAIPHQVVDDRYRGEPRPGAGGEFLRESGYKARRGPTRHDGPPCGAPGPPFPPEQGGRLVPEPADQPYAVFDLREGSVRAATGNVPSRHQVIFVGGDRERLPVRAFPEFPAQSAEHIERCHR